MRLPLFITRRLDRWVDRVMTSRPPDYTVGETSDPYMLRWFVIPRNRWMNIYVHEFHRSDDPRALHDHPWINCSIVVHGLYREHTILAGGIHHSEILSAGQLRFRRSTSAHRLEVFKDCHPPRTIFITGPVLRAWGFHCPKGWVPFEDFAKLEVREDGTKISTISAGCGDKA